MNAFHPRPLPSVAPVTLLALLTALLTACSTHTTHAGHSTQSVDATSTTPAPATAAAPAASAAPAATSNAQAEQADGPYLYTLLRNPRMQRAWQHMTPNAPEWVRKAQGPTIPATRVQVGGKTYWQGSVCEQHNCPNTVFYLLNETHAYGVQGNFGNLRQLRPVFYGAPPKAEHAALQAIFDQERQRQVADQAPR